MNSRPVEIDKTQRLTRPAVEALRERVRSDPGFVGNVLGEAVECLLDNDIIVAQLLLRDVTNCTVGFPALARETGIMEKSLMRMLSVKGNPQASNLFRILSALQRLNNLKLVVRAV